MKRRSIIAALAVCAALLLPPSVGQAYTPAQGIEIDDAYVVWWCADAKPREGDPCPGYKMVVVRNRWIGPKPPPAD